MNYLPKMRDVRGLTATPVVEYSHSLGSESYSEVDYVQQSTRFTERRRRIIGACSVASLSILAICLWINYRSGGPEQGDVVGSGLRDLVGVKAACEPWAFQYDGFCYGVVDQTMYSSTDTDAQIGTKELAPHYALVPFSDDIQKNVATKWMFGTLRLVYANGETWASGTAAAGASSCGRCDCKNCKIDKNLHEIIHLESTSYGVVNADKRAKIFCRRPVQIPAEVVSKAGVKVEAKPVPIVDLCPQEPCTAKSLGIIGTTQAGVNLGGWLVLEDWFFSQASALDAEMVVSSPKYAGEGRVFPSDCGGEHGHFGGGRGTWRSEGEMTTWLLHEHEAKRGADPFGLFGRHRDTFIMEEDFKQIASLGLKLVRLPIPWQTFADALCSLKTKDKFFGNYCNTDPETKTMFVPDPFYHVEMQLMTVPRSILTKALGWAQKHGLRVVLDVHTMVGGSSDGTYSSVWPLKPAFWQECVSSECVPLRDIGLNITSALIDWVAGLGELKPVVAGLTFMNEPAMEAFGGKELGGADWLDKQDDVLDWLSDATALFEARKLELPDAKVYVNLHSSAFKKPPADKPVPFWPFPIYVPDPAYAWFQKQFKNKPWAFLDIHFYEAWDRTNFPEAPLCDTPSLDALTAETQKFAKETFTDNPDLSEMALQGRMAMSEFSSATFDKVRLACNNKTFTRAFLYRQVSEVLKVGIQPFFWTWRMPEGGMFQDGWSLKKIVGLEKEPKGRSCALEVAK